MSLEQEKKNLFRLIETWEKENIELAFQLIEGNPAYKAAVEARYLPILKNLFDIEDLAILRDIQRRYPVFILGDWQPSAEQLEVLESIPMKSVAFAYNKIEIFPEWICHLHQIKTLNLQNNQLKKIPDAIVNLKQLEILNLNNNQISDLPKMIGELTELRRLNLDFTQKSQQNPQAS